MTKLRDIFEKPVDRAIEGVIKADDEAIQEANQLGLDRREYTRRKALGDSICTGTGENDYHKTTACKHRVLETGQ
jgi:hypothetical protein